MASAKTTNSLTSLASLWYQALPVVSAYVFGAIPNFHEAEDVIQQVAVTVTDKFSEYDPRHPFTRWAIGIARIKVLQHFDSQRRDRHQFCSEALEAIAASYTRLSPELDSLKAPLEQCIERLTPRSQQMLELRYVRDLKPRQIAVMLGMTSTAVTSLLHRLREALRRCIEQRGHRGEGVTS